jgi:hypothetical protein
VPSRVNAGVDLLIFDKKTGRLVKVVESTNYAESSFMKEDRILRYVNSLNEYDALPNVEKVIVVSYLTNIMKRISSKTLELVENSHIKVDVVGRQD